MKQRTLHKKWYYRIESMESLVKSGVLPPEVLKEAMQLADSIIEEFTAEEAKCYMFDRLTDELVVDLLGEIKYE